MREHDTGTTQAHDSVASLRQELEARKALWRELVECVPAGVMVLDKAGNIRHLNRNMTAMFDIKSRNAAGRHYADILPDDIAEEVRLIRAEAMEKGCVINRTLRHSLDKAITIDLGINATLFKASGEPLTIVVCHDRTAVNELERLRALDAKKTESISRAAHELKNPLSAIKAYCEVLAEMYSADGTASGFLKGIDDETERLLRLVSELLNVSSIESGRLQLTLDEVNLADVVRETLYNIDMTNRNHRLVLRTEEGVPPIVADQVMMKEVITNLVSNAINYSPAGGDIIIEIHKEGRNVRMDVIDQGLGIPREHLANVFEKFYRVYRPDQPDVPGCGLGLAIVKGIVEAHKGTITAESNVGEGSRFSVLLPVSRAFDLNREEAALQGQPFA
jgi:PAS domain S-box-containing protein